MFCKSFHSNSFNKFNSLGNCAELSATLYEHKQNNGSLSVCISLSVASACTLTCTLLLNPIKLPTERDILFKLKYYAGMCCSVLVRA